MKIFVFGFGIIVVKGILLLGLVLLFCNFCNKVILNKMIKENIIIVMIIGVWGIDEYI